MDRFDEQLDDAALMARIQNGDDAALGGLYDRHGGRAYSLAFAILRNGHDAEDAVARAFAQVWSGRDRYDPAQGAFSGWLSTIVRSRALDLYRARQRRTRAYGAAREAGDPGWHPLGPDEQAEAKETRRIVVAALLRLPEDQRQPLALAYFRGMSHSEIAIALELPLGTVKTRIRSAMQRLRDQLTGELELGVS
jgi:RNA polymerase sigma-70 factor (ECF subfamily)